MAMNIGSIADEAYKRIDNMSAGTSGNLISFTSGAVIDLGNILNVSIGVPITEKYQNVLTNMTTLYALSRETGIGIDANSVKLGDFSINKGAKSTPEAAQMDFLANQINMSVRGIGRNITTYKAFG